MKIIPEVGDIVIVKRFSFTNKSGGTSISNQQIKCKISKAWYDYECGWRYWAEPLEEIDPAQFAEICQELGSEYNNSGTIYVSQFETVSVEGVANKKVVVK